MTSHQLYVRFTSEISEFSDLLEELGYPEKENEPERTNTLKQTRRYAIVGILVMIIISIVSLVKVIIRGETPSTVYYFSLAFSALLCFLGVWGIIRSMKFQRTLEKGEAILNKK